MNKRKVNEKRKEFFKQAFDDVLERRCRWSSDLKKQIFINENNNRIDYFYQMLETRDETKKEKYTPMASLMLRKGKDGKFHLVIKQNSQYIPLWSNESNRWMELFQEIKEYYFDLIKTNNEKIYKAESKIQNLKKEVCEIENELELLGSVV